MKYVMLCLALLACKVEPHSQSAEAPANVPTPTPNMSRTVGEFSGGFGTYRLQAIDDSLRGVTCYKVAGTETVSCVVTFDVRSNQ